MQKHALIKRLIKFCFSLLFALVGMRGHTQFSAQDSARVFKTVDEIALNPKRVFRIHLTKQKLEAFPEIIFMCPNLQELVLDKNRLREIPDQINQLKGLKHFSVKQNKIEKFPGALLELNQLEFLDLGENWIDSIPDEIDRLQNLRTLSLWDNPIEHYPQELGNMPALLVLDLLNNQMSKETQRRLKSDLPKCKLIVSPPCACMDGDQ